MYFKYSDLRKQVLADQYKIKNFACDKNWPLALEAWKETEYVQDRENGNDFTAALPEYEKPLVSDSSSYDFQRIEFYFDIMQS